MRQVRLKRGKDQEEMRSVEPDVDAARAYRAGRLRVHGVEVDSDGCFMSHGGVMEQSSRRQRSLSPRREEGPRQVSRQRKEVMDRDQDFSDRGDIRESQLRRSGLMVRDEEFCYRGDLVQPQLKSPAYKQVQEKPPHHYQASLSRDEIGRRYELFDCDNRYEAARTGVNYDYEYDSARSVKGHNGNKERGGVHHHGLEGHRLLALEDGSIQGAHTLPFDSQSASKYVETARSPLSALAQSRQIRLRDEIAHYPDPYLLDKLSAIEMLEREERSRFHPKDVSLYMESASRSKDLAASSQYKKCLTTSSGTSRMNSVPMIQDDMHFLGNIHSRSSTKLRQPLHLNEYGENHSDNTLEDYSAGHKELTSYQYDKVSSPKGRPRDTSDYGHSCERTTFLEQTVLGKRHARAQIFLEPRRENLSDNEFSRRDATNSSSWDHHSLNKQPVSMSFFDGRSLVRSSQGQFYMNSDDTNVDTQNLRESDMDNLDVPCHEEIPLRRLDYHSSKDEHSNSYAERWRRSPRLEHELEMLGDRVRLKKIESDMEYLDVPCHEEIPVRRLDYHSSKDEHSNSYAERWRRSPRLEHEMEMLGDRVRLKKIESDMEYLDVPCHEETPVRRLDYHSSKDEHSNSYAERWRRSPRLEHELEMLGDRVRLKKIESDMENLDVPCHEEIPVRRLDYHSSKDEHSNSYADRWRRSPRLEHEMEMLGDRVRLKKIESGVNGCDGHPIRPVKSRYIIDEENMGHNSGRIVFSEWKININRTQDIDYRNEVRDDQDASGLLSPENFEDDKWFGKEDRTHSRDLCGRVSATDGLLSYSGSISQGQRHLIRPYNHGKKQKVHENPSSLRQSVSIQNRKHHLTKDVWIRGKNDKQTEASDHVVKELKDQVACAETELPEDSIEFKQLIHNFFLSYTKKLNESVATQKRYKEQGRAGGFYCIVCAKSQLKEFKDTRSLAIHCFMSQKVGLKAKHLGLHKAICVLMGWNSDAPPDGKLWAPVTVRAPNALAQKEDLILWPPVVVIHNYSGLVTGLDGQKVTSTEAVEDFLRGKGFSGGKMRVCLGKPANGSVLLVKFLGTIPGIQDAEKLHNYFMEEGRGRIDFGVVTSAKGKGIDNRNVKEDKVEKLVLYGYMGIAEDLDKVDVDTKRKCLIKSKKEIHDFVDGPVKSVEEN